MASATMPLPCERHPHRLFRALGRRRTYGNLLYLLLALPIGYVYLYAFNRLLRVLYGSLGFLAFPVLVLFCTLALATFERALARWLLGTMFTPMAPTLPPGAPGDTPPNTVALSVTDTGIGIPDDDLDLIFERFYRSDASRTRDTGGFGFGLGLSIVRDLVRAMGGEVAAERVPAGGSRFRVTLRAVPIIRHTSERGGA